MIFLSEQDHSTHAKSLEKFLRRELPDSYRGYSVIPKNRTRDSSGFEIHTIRKFLLNYLGFDIQKDLEPADWLAFPEQKLLSFTQGAVYTDGVGLEEIRRRFTYYPLDIWLYLLAAGWNRIGQEEHLMGRAGEAGDEIGSALIAARLIRDIIRLWFLMERKYAPYAKWLGTAFTRLEGSKDLLPIVQEVLGSNHWEKRQERLAEAYEILAAKHNTLKITEPLDEKRSYFFDRPFLVIDAKRFSDAITAQIVDPTIKKIAKESRIGNIDQISDNTDLLADPRWWKTLRKLYE